MSIYYWYDDRRQAAYADCAFDPFDSVYRGNIYDVNGDIIGDFYSFDSVEIENRFPGIFGD